MEELEGDGKAGEFKWFFRHYPRADYPESVRAAFALAAAVNQEPQSFWQLFWNLIVATEITDENVVGLAEAAGLDVEEFGADYGSEAGKAIINRDIDLAEEIGFSGTPGIVLCGQPVEPDADAIIDNLDHLIHD